MNAGNNAGTCNELEVRIDGKIGGRDTHGDSAAGIYEKQTYLLNDRNVYVHRHQNEQSLTYNSETASWEVQ